MPIIDRRTSGFYFVKENRFQEYCPEILTSQISANTTSETLLESTLSIISYKIKQEEADLFVNQFLSKSLLILLINLDNLGEEEKLPRPNSASFNQHCNELLGNLIHQVQGNDRRSYDRTVRNIRMTPLGYYWRLFLLEPKTPEFAAMIAR